MPRYFFHVSDGQHWYRDDEAVELPDLDPARAHARRDARDLVCEPIADDVALAFWKIIVCGDDGTELFSTPVPEGVRIRSAEIRNGSADIPLLTLNRGPG